METTWAEWEKSAKELEPDETKLKSKIPETRLRVMGAKKILLP